MNSNQKKLVLNVTDRSLEEINNVAKELKTNQSGVISQALALFMMVQGKKVVIQDQSKNTNLEINTYSSQPARSKRGG